MPMMGRAPDSNVNKLNNVKMARQNNSNKKTIASDPTKSVDLTKSYDSKVVDKLSGMKPRSVYKEGRHNEMGKDEFLKLLSHQLRHQDPMNPMDQNKFAGDLAQYAQLEQLSNMNSKFDKLNPNVAQEDKFYGASFLGKEVITSGASVKYSGNGEKADIYFNLSEPADKLMVKILDKSGNIINEMWHEKMSAGAHKLSWDGNDLAGNPEKAGEYQIAVQAWDATGGVITAQTQVQGTVDSVYFENGETVLIVDGKKVFLRDVDSFHMPKSKKVPDLDKLTEEGQNKVKDSAIHAYKNNAPIDQAEKSVYDYEQR